jgi:hypothetical protein
MENQFVGNLPKTPIDLRKFVGKWSGFNYTPWSIFDVRFFVDDRADIPAKFTKEDSENVISVWATQDMLFIQMQLTPKDKDRLDNLGAYLPKVDIAIGDRTGEIQSVVTFKCCHVLYVGKPLFSYLIQSNEIAEYLVMMSYDKYLTSEEEKK